MNTKDYDLEGLTMNARRGDRAAAAIVQQQMAPHWVPIVQRVLQDGRGTTPLSKRILAEATQILIVAWEQGRERPKDLVQQLAQRAAEWCRADLTPTAEPWTMETVRGA